MVLLLTEPADEGLRCQLLALTVRGQAVLGKAIVEERDDGDGGCGELFFLLNEVRASDLLGSVCRYDMNGVTYEANGTLMAERS